MQTCLMDQKWDLIEAEAYIVAYYNNLLIQYIIIYICIVAYYNNVILHCSIL